MLISFENNFTLYWESKKTNNFSYHYKIVWTGVMTEALSMILKATCGQPDAFLLRHQNSAHSFNSAAVTTKQNKSQIP